MELQESVFTSDNVQFPISEGSRWARFLSPILPGSLRQRFGVAVVNNFVFKGSGTTNLFLLTETRAPANSIAPKLGRLKVFDAAGEEYEAGWGLVSLDYMPTRVFHAWQVPAFPRRGRELGFRVLAATPDGDWTNGVEFKIPNPAYAKYPQWTAESWPVAKRSGDLEVTLKEFESGGPMTGPRGQGSVAMAARMTRVALGFQQAGRPVDNWRLQTPTISDATGNRWSPYRNSEKVDSSWGTNGTAEFMGALWPSEDAWRLKAEVARTSGFSPDEVWNVALPIPAAGAVTALTNQWEHEGLGVELVGLGSPKTEHPGEFMWVAKSWGEAQDETYSLAVKLGTEPAGRRFSLVKAVDQAGHDVKVVKHQGTDGREQAVFFRPGASTTEVHFTFVIQRSRFVEFLARPEFVK